ncbi:MAG TPA: hypothetical protein VE733_07915, partial [Streptosporangiaceae bacterium]|nr:hypothetical protein [Streptosporangiaceae bacterium]
KGYSTPEPMTALCTYGPCPEQRYSYANVIEANRRWATGWRGGADLEDGAAQDGDAEREPCAPAGADSTAIGDFGDALADAAAIGGFEGGMADATVTGGAEAGRPVSRVEDSGPPVADVSEPGDVWADLWREGASVSGAGETDAAWVNTRRRD